MIDGLTSVLAGDTVDGDLSAEPAPFTADRSSPGTDAADPTLLRVRMVELAGRRKSELDGDYRFEQLPAPNDQVVMRNRRGRTTS